MKTILMANKKGGVGKTTIALLLVEYCNHKHIPVAITDTDSNKSFFNWSRYCQEEGRPVVCDEKDAAVHIIDTAGADGAATHFLRSADVIVCPFKANFADTDVVLVWFDTLNAKHQEKFVFVPNMRGLAGEQGRIIEDVQQQINETQKGRLLVDCGLRNRDAVYPDVVKGQPTNFFEITKDDLQAHQWKSFSNAQNEAAKLCEQILKIAGVMS